MKYLKKKKEKLISNFNVRVKKNVFISVNKYTYIYILYIWNYIFFRCGRIFFMIYPYVYIYITWELRLADLSHTMLLRYGSLCFVCCIISVLDFIQYYIVQDDFYYLWSCFYVFLRKKIQLLIWNCSCLLNTVIIIKCKKLKNV